MEIKKLGDLYGNTVAIYSIQKLLDRKAFPKFSILSGRMGVGKTTAAKVIASEISPSVRVFNFGLELDLKDIKESVFSLNPAQPVAFIFEEFPGGNEETQIALTNMLDNQPSNVYIICTTTDIHKVIRPIVSRATVWDFRSLKDTQMLQLLDDFLAENNYTMHSDTKSAIIRMSKGIPRDLLKNAQFAMAGDFVADELEGMSGTISDDLIFTVLSCMGTDPITFHTTVETVMDSCDSPLSQFRDYVTRYLLERRSSSITIPAKNIKTLDKIFEGKKLQALANGLISANNYTFLLNLCKINLIVSENTDLKSSVGLQLDIQAQHEAEGRRVSANNPLTKRSKVSGASKPTAGLSKLTLGD